MSNTINIRFMTLLEANKAVYELVKADMAYGLEKRLYRAPELFSEATRALLLSIDGRELQLQDNTLAYQTVTPFKFHNIKGIKDGREL